MSVAVRAPAATALALTGIHKAFGGHTVLDGASLELAAGEVAWLGGHNGAGKTTLLRIAAGLIRPDAGTVSLGGLDPERDRRAYQRRLGFLSAGDRGIYARLTVRQNLELWGALAFVPRRERPAAVARALERFRLGELAGHRSDRLSMGQRQRVRLALTFLHEPGFVLLDEPHTSLDGDGEALLRAALGDLAAAGGAALWCSPGGAEPLPADRRFAVEDGRVAEL